jgi:hypothetical protein
MHGSLKRRGGYAVPSGILAVALVAGLFAGRVLAHDNQFGGQDRADAAERLIVLAVQQGIGSLPPMSGQSFSYDFDRETGTYVRSPLLGPTALRSTRTVGEGKTSVRFAASYFELSDDFGPINYKIAPEDPAVPEPRGFAAVGLSASARVSLLNIAVSHGLTRRIDLLLNVPVVIVDADAKQSFTTRASALGVPARDAVLSGARTVEDLDILLRLGALAFRRERFDNLGFDFAHGTHVGLGRVSLGGKGLLYSEGRLQVALATELFLPSPNQDELAGSESVALFPRLLAEVSVTKRVRLHLDAGYDYDFDNAELRRAVWSVGPAFAANRFSLDLGVAGSIFDAPLKWTPNTARGAAAPPYPATRAVAAGDNSVGDLFVDLLVGAKFRLRENLVLSGAVSIPVNDEGFRPAALGTIGIEAQL